MATQQPAQTEDVLKGVGQRVSMHDFGQLHELVEKGVPASTISRMEKHLGLSARQTVKLLGISDSTRKRLKGKPRMLLNSEVTDRLVRVLQVFDETVEVFDDVAKAKRWLLEHSYALGGRCPIDLLSSAPGVQLILEELNTIKYGNWA